jgi:putative transposase
MNYAPEVRSTHQTMYHLNWTPRRWRKVFVGLVHDRLKHIIQEVAGEHRWEIIRVAIELDHVHLFIRATPYILPSGIPRLIMGCSSHDVREEFPYLRKLPSLWTDSYFLSTAGNVRRELTQKHIERQSKT